ncbi:MAG: EAL domain-containing protein [Methylomonas sp.]|jgi:diguanylate cyclase (GGDEF)-like protein/PAS domain S-box-containing protein|uniref:diguanylate cyclase domain-containing protein n=1 Tax=Methylomonas sp. TaxID=418 RepID=UPI0025CDD565|nr:EAL domain-containing protein [Methylomonas sp.]MCK9606297.1 EAL domain-containing protein [Methylomonas sp.]
MITDFSAHWFQQVLDHLGQGMAILDTEGCLVWCNRAYAQITGFCRQAHIGQAPPHIVDHARLLCRAKFQLEVSGNWQGEAIGITEKGQPLALLVSLSHIPNPQGGRNWLLEHFFEIDSYLGYIKQLESQALHDPLSGLPNRSYFRSEINGAFQVHQQSQRTVAVMFIDLDGFKLINDRTGHESGDYVLMIVAQRLRHSAKQHHGFVARMGGDEFALLLMDTDADQAQNVAAAVLTDIEQPITVGKRMFRVSASIGIYHDQYAHTHASELLRRADQTMYQIKKQGGHGYKLQSGAMVQHERKPPTEAWRTEIDNALSNHEFSAFAQPIVDIQTGRVTAIETRVRWQAQRGLLTAKEVLNHVSQANREETLDFLMLEQALAILTQLKQCASRLPALRIAVNLSAATCLNQDFLQRLCLYVDSRQLPCKRFRFDIPEKAFVLYPAQMAELVVGLVEKGFEVAADHITCADVVNTVLAEIPITIIKLDEFLVSGLPDSADAMFTATAIIAAAKRHGFAVGAEGVGWMKQLEWLRNAGCRECQGELIGSPKPPDEALTAIKTGRYW